MALFAIAAEYSILCMAVRATSCEFNNTALWCEFAHSEHWRTRGEPCIARYMGSWWGALRQTSKSLQSPLQRALTSMDRFRQGLVQSNRDTPVLAVSIGRSVHVKRRGDRDRQAQH